MGAFPDDKMTLRKASQLFHGFNDLTVLYDMR